MFHLRQRLAAAGFGMAILVGDPLGATDAFAQFSLISVAQGGGPGNGASRDVAIDASGRFVAFASDATNLVTGDNNASADVFVRDRQLNATTRVSVTSGGAEAAGASGQTQITPDGRFVVFSSYAALVAGDTNSCASPAGVPTCSDIYVHDRQTNTTTRISVSSQGAEGDNHSVTPSISADGRYVVFSSDATNFVAGDTNNHSDVFLHDRQTNTTTRVSRSLVGLEMPLGGSSPKISADGELIMYSGYATSQEVVDQSTCDPALSMCLALYQVSRSTGISAILSNVFPGSAPATFRLTLMRATAISTDGRFVVVEQQGIALGALPGKNSRARSIVHDRVMNRTTAPSYTGGFGVRPDKILGMSGDGRTYADLVNPFAIQFNAVFRWSDRISGLSSILTSPAMLQQFAPTEVAMSLDARFMAFATGSALTGDDVSNGLADIFVHDRDPDGDGMPSAWETTFGLDPDVANPNADADTDGIVNLDEYLRGSHPAATHTRYFAEGAANSFFATRFAVLNPGDTPVSVVLRYLGQNGEVASDLIGVAAKSRKTVNVPANRIGMDPSFSTVVESDQLVVADRTMYWGVEGYRDGGHTETSLAAPSTTWHLAEGATHGAFDLFYLFQNPNPTKATVTVNYLRLDPATPVVKTYEVEPNSRRTIWVDDEGPELAAVDLGAAITSDLPIVVERAMYSTRPGQAAFAAGHGGAGVTAPAPKWFLAEGATGNFFDLYVLIANPNASDSEVKVTYLLGTGSESFSKTYTVGGRTRKTLSIKDEDPRLAGTIVSMIVETTNNQPLVVERAMWWPRDQWYEAHLSAGATSTGTRWALAEGEVSEASETYILIANTSATAGTATVTLYPEFSDPVTHTVDLDANSRVNVPVSPFLPTTPGAFGAVVQSSGVEIVVERAMYRTTSAGTWAIGTAALATKLQ